MQNKRWMITLLCLGVIAIGCSGVARAQSDSSDKASDPDALLSPDTSIYLRLGGHSTLAEKLRKSAIYDSIYGSGLADMLGPLAKQGLELAAKESGAPPEARPTIATIQKTLEHVFKHGATAGAVIRLLGPEATLVLHNAEKDNLADEIQTRLKEFLDLAGVKSEQKKVEGRTLTTFSQPAAFGPVLQIGWWKEGPHLVFTVGFTDAADVVERAAGKVEGLTKSKKYDHFRPHKNIELAGQFWVDVEGLLSQIPADAAEAEVVFKKSGIARFQGFKVQWGFDGDALRSDVDVLLPAPRAGYMKAVDGPAIRLENLPKLPADCNFVSYYTLAPAHLYDTVINTTKSIIEEVSPDDIDEFTDGIEQAEEFLGFKIRDDLAAAVGDSAVVYQSNLDGPLGLGGVTFVIGVKDRTRLAKTLDRLAERIKQQDSKFLIERKQYQGADLWIGGYRQQGFPLAPTIGLTDQWAIIGALTPAQVMRFIRLQKGKGKSWQPPKPLTQMFAQTKGAVMGATYVNPQPIARMISTSVPLLAALARNSAPQLKIDLTQLPDIERMFSGIPPSISIISVDDAGLHVVNRLSKP